MNRERVLKVVLVAGGLLFTACDLVQQRAILWHPNRSLTADTADCNDDEPLFHTLGFSCCLAARNPSAHRSLIAFTEVAALLTGPSWLSWSS